MSLRALMDNTGKMYIEDDTGLFNAIHDAAVSSSKYSLDITLSRKHKITGAYDIAQVETATIVGTITKSGNASVTVKSALFEADEVLTVPVELDDDASAIALAIRTALAANEIIAEHFIVSGATDKVILTAKVPAANDATLNIAVDNGINEACEGITADATSTNTTAGGIKQVETATAAGTVTTAGRAKCTLTADGMPGSPLHVPFDVELGDGAEEIAASLRLALANHAIVDITDYFDISGEGAEIILTKKAPAADDETLNIAISDGEGEGASVGVTTSATSVDTTAGRANTEQAETATAIGTITKAGYALITVKSALFDDEVINVAVELDDEAADVAAAIRAALTANETVSEHFTVSGEGADIVLTAKVAALNDATLNIAIDNGVNEASEGITTAASSANTTASGIANKAIEILSVPQISEKITINVYADFTAILPTLSYPASVIWLNGSVPSLEAGKYYELEFYTVDGGAVWFGKLSATYNS